MNASEEGNQSAAIERLARRHDGLTIGNPNWPPRLGGAPSFFSSSASLFLATLCVRALMFAIIIIPSLSLPRPPLAPERADSKYLIYFTRHDATAFTSERAS